MTQFHMTVWPEHGRPTSTGSVIEMLDMITKAQMSCGNRTITVLCKSVNVLYQAEYDSLFCHNIQ